MWRRRRRKCEVGVSCVGFLEAGRLRGKGEGGRGKGEERGGRDGD